MPHFISLVSRSPSVEGEICGLMGGLKSTAWENVLSTSPCSRVKDYCHYLVKRMCEVDVCLRVWGYRLTCFVATPGTPRTLHNLKMIGKWLCSGPASGTRRMSTPGSAWHPSSAHSLFHIYLSPQRKAQCRPVWRGTRQGAERAPVCGF